jgi:hypothetical protein
MVGIRRVAPRAGRASGTATACPLPIPWPARMLITDPTAVVAERASHRSHQAQGELAPVPALVALDEVLEAGRDVA